MDAPVVDTEVLIVGAGPTGLMLANQLARRGVRTRIVDRHSGPAQQTRAMAVQARTLEIYAALGVVDQALALGRQAAGANLWAEGQLRARIPLGDIGAGLSPYPFVLMLGQDDNERILGARLADFGVAVEWNTELIALEQDAGGVQAVLRRADGSTRTLRSAYVAGCDGAHSAVRGLSAIDFPGAPYEHVFFVADTRCTGPMVPDELNVYLWRDGFHLFFPMRGQDAWRVIGVLPKALRERDAVRFEDIEAAIAQEAGAEVRFSACNWFSTYRIHHRCAARFQDRRCFLLGDAAHIHSPAGGQGMNTGLQDAYNLAWKLALVVRGEADPALLASYEEERRPVAQRLLRTTDRAFTMLVSDSWMAGLLRTRVLGWLLADAMERERIRTLAFKTLSQTGIRYRRSSLSVDLPGMPDAGPRAGDRFPWLRVHLGAGAPLDDIYRVLDDTRFNLVRIAPRADSAPVPDHAIAEHRIDPGDADNRAALERVGVPADAFYLLRPDGYIGLAGMGTPDASATQYLAQRIRATA